MRNRLAVLAMLIIAVVVFAAFLPCLWDGFCYDDERSVTGNANFRGLEAQHLRWMFTTFHMGHYQPLAWLTLAIDYKLWGLAPFGYHLTNLILHVINAILVYRLTIALISVSAGLGSVSRPGPRIHAAAVLAALLFAVHPLRVESVAWITERRDVLSSCFLLLTVLAYLRAHALEASQPRRGWLVVALLTYTLSLLSRAMAVTLPVILLLLDCYPLRRLGSAAERPLGRDARGVWLEKLPFALLALVAGVLAPMAQHRAGATISLADHNLLARVAQACYGLVFYCWKTLLPVGLVPIYELARPHNSLSGRYVISAALVLLAAVARWGARRRAPARTDAALAYAVLLAPVLGFVQSGPQEVADRYSYLPAVVAAVLVGAGLTRLLQTRRRTAPLVAAVACLALAGLSILTWRQCRVWESHETLWTYTVKTRPSSIACYNLASTYGQQGRTDLAIRHYIEAVRLNPRSKKSLYQLGNALSDTGQTEQALAAYREALNVDPNFALANYGLGRLLAARGDGPTATEYLRRAIANQPDYAAAHNAYGALLLDQGQLDAALEHLRAAQRLDPANADASYNLGLAFLALRRFDDAGPAFRAALGANPEHVHARYNLALLLDRQGQAVAAAAEYRTLGDILVQQNHLSDAAAAYRATIRLLPDEIDARCRLADLLVAQGQADEAIVLLQEALRINPDLASAKARLHELSAPKPPG